MPTLSYQTDGNKIGLIRLSQAKVAVYGNQPVGPPDLKLMIYGNKNVKKYGIRARYHLYYETVGTGDNTARKYYHFPIGTPDGFNTVVDPISYKTKTLHFAKGVAEDDN